MTMPIVAGTDGSEETMAAVGWAAAEAARRRVPLSIVHVVDPHDSVPAAHAQPPHGRAGWLPGGARPGGCACRQPSESDYVK